MSTFKSLLKGKFKFKFRHYFFPLELIKVIKTGRRVIQTMGVCPEKKTRTVLSWSPTENGMTTRAPHASNTSARREQVSCTLILFSICLDRKQGIFYANSSHFIANRIVRNIMSVTLPSCEYIIIWGTPETCSIEWSVHLHRVSTNGTIKGI